MVPPTPRQQRRPSDAPQSGLVLPRSHADFDLRGGGRPNESPHAVDPSADRSSRAMMSVARLSDAPSVAEFDGGGGLDRMGQVRASEVS